MIFNIKSLEMFRELGMSTQQAKVYLSLSELEQATVKKIAIDAQMARAEVYRVIPALRKLGLIQKIIATPTIFRAVPLSEGLKILLQLKAENHGEIRVKVEQFLQNFKSQNRKEQYQINAKHYLTIGLKPVIRDYLNDLQNTQESKDCIIEWVVLLFLATRDFEYFKEIAGRGAKIRYITDIPKGEEIPPIIQMLIEKGFIEIKCVSTIPKARLDIFDKKLVHIILPNSGLKDIEVLRSNDSAIASLLQDYFDMKWQAATTPCWSKKNHQMRTQA